MKKKELTKFRENYTDWDVNKQVYTEGLALAVHFDEKETVKQFGAHWNSSKKLWWLPRAKCTAERIKKLNDEKMIHEPYGAVDADLVGDMVMDAPFESFKLCNIEGDAIVFDFYVDHDIVNVHVSRGIDTIVNQKTAGFHSTKDGRLVWDSLVETGGWTRVSSA